MKKAQVFSLESKKEDQRIAEMKMTAQERWELAFQLIELARVFTPDKTFLASPDESIEWIDLKFKDERVKGSR
jgi:hypothetical protein